jgi:hypothetical protein
MKERERENNSLINRKQNARRSPEGEYLRSKAKNKTPILNRMFSFGFGNIPIDKGEMDNRVDQTY